jgi:hypothetical protein
MADPWTVAMFAYSAAAAAAPTVLPALGVGDLGSMMWKAELNFESREGMG